MSACIYRRNGTFHHGECVGGGAAYVVIVPAGKPRSESFTVSFMDYWPTTDMADVEAHLRAEHERATQYALNLALRGIRQAISPAATGDTTPTNTP